jgi:hypothetical protein
MFFSSKKYLNVALQNNIKKKTLNRPGIRAQHCQREINTE